MDEVTARTYDAIRYRGLGWIQPRIDPERLPIDEQRDLVAHLAEAVRAGRPDGFIRSVAWLADVRRRRGVGPRELSEELKKARDAFQEWLSDSEYALVRSFLSAGVEHAVTPEPPAESAIPEDGPLSELARGYLEHVLAGSRRLAVDAILGAVRSGTGVRDLYLHVFQPVQYEIGRLWQSNEISVADEHYCTATTQLAMSQLAPTLFAESREPRHPHPVVVAAVSGELHEIGPRMVADFLELDGWDTIFLGANTPSDAILSTLAQRKSPLVCLSSTLEAHFGEAVKLVAAIRDSAIRTTKILVGGRAFSREPGLWKAVGADALGTDAADAVATAERLLEETAG